MNYNAYLLQNPVVMMHLKKKTWFEGFNLKLIVVL